MSPGTWNNADQPLTADDDDRQPGEEDASDEAAHLLHLGHVRRDTLLDRPRLRRRNTLHHLADFRQSRDHLRNLLDRAERRAVGHRKHQRRHDRRPAELGREERRDARTLERACRLLLLPDRRLGQERTDEDERNRGNHAGHERVAPDARAGRQCPRCQARRRPEARRRTRPQGRWQTPPAGPRATRTPACSRALSRAASAPGRARRATRWRRQTPRTRRRTRSSAGRGASRSRSRSRTGTPRPHR